MRPSDDRTTIENGKGVTMNHPVVDTWEGQELYLSRFDTKLWKKRPER